MREFIGGIEAGGTHFNCIIANSPTNILSEIQFPTTTPEETLTLVSQYFTNAIKKESITLKAIGLASFGPLDLVAESPTYGHILSTPKLAWQNYPILQTLHEKIQRPIFMDTDVNCAAFGEHAWGAGKGLDDFVYITVGTGIGGGIFSNGKLIHGTNHPELGHNRIPHDLTRDPFPGNCPFHKDCFEGLAAGPSLEERWKTRGENLPKEHPAWALEAQYIALALNNLVCTLASQRIILGGGVMQQSFLFPMIRKELFQLLNKYIETAADPAVIEKMVVPPGLGKRSGTLGAIALAQSQSHSTGE